MVPTYPRLPRIFFMPITVCCPHKCLKGTKTEATDISDTFFTNAISILGCDAL